LVHTLKPRRSSVGKLTIDHLFLYTPMSSDFECDVCPLAAKTTPAASIPDLGWARWSINRICLFGNVSVLWHRF